MGRRSTPHTLSRRIGSSPSRANTFNDTSYPDLGMFSAFIEDREKWTVFPETPKLSARLLKQSVVSKPLSKNALVSISGPLSPPRTLTGTICKLTRDLPDLTAAHCASWPAPLGPFRVLPSGKGSWVVQPTGVSTRSSANLRSGVPIFFAAGRNAWYNYLTVRLPPPN